MTGAKAAAATGGARAGQQVQELQAGAQIASVGGVGRRRRSLGGVETLCAREEEEEKS